MDHPTEGHNGPPECRPKAKGKWLLGLQNRQKDLMGQVSHLRPDKVKKAIDMRRSTIINELDILTQDYRVEQFNQKSRAETREDYTTRIRVSNPGNEAGQ